MYDLGKLIPLLGKLIALAPCVSEDDSMHTNRQTPR